MLTVILLPLLLSNVGAANAERCDCYITSGPSPGYFRNYKFYDYRNLTSQLPDSNNISSFLSSSSFLDVFSPQDWAQSSGPDNPIPFQNSVSNVFVSSDSQDSTTTLNLRTTRRPTYQSAAEIEGNQKNLLHASIRIRARIKPGSSPGACAGLFTYAQFCPTCTSDPDGKNPESDIEILTRDPNNTIRYANQPVTRDIAVPNGTASYNDTEIIPGASSTIKISNGKTWDTFLTHRLDWFEGVSRFWVDDTLLLSKTYGVPVVPLGLIINLWSTGGSWTGNMSIGDEATLSIEYVEMAFNTSGPFSGPKENGKRSISPRRWLPSVFDGLKGLRTESRNLKLEERSEKHCKVVCTIDGVKEVGKPEIASTGEIANTGEIASIGDGSKSLPVAASVLLCAALVAVLVL